ncbi:Asp-tRNA(Asn)/Glu-tRNA(Gln) amidotransferase GatCAB subunit C [Actinobacteria bacterium YIM 96077]|uniref:Asp-tRNA(Asn)/Glu-tRNA(Gln) amidotransferase GatCAB subunit C n=1 Tax=Phytoactinopolyspora halophila TaxID=1981511 RepID=A0A329QEJ8_9ACTN|nr:molybdopterin-dependent oxidoreductase [Phytoactinopolyspora halophila]AYY13578.1 Asp-tRNA(Asn)/Glu-tRNA(Gln) amidotransferase GatCAB subunit C [Actinobacteria bacterium YIM 96077]RAW10756.1 Asp-tRNA(Asn)/Glu-tRNA(Gln) amidotransferase GatCAB subunit C [Phytoactinopolyspora halophila]
MSTAPRSGQTASHWGRYEIVTDGAEVVQVHGAHEDPDPSPIGDNYVGSLRHRARVLRPAVRRGWLDGGPGSTRRRGGDEYVEVSLDEAVELCATELERVRREHGNEAIFGGSYGWGSAGRFHHAQSQVHRFLSAIGGYTRSLNTYSHAAEEVVLPHIVGNREWFLRSLPRWSQIAEHTDLVVAFGGLPRGNVQVNPGGLGSHQNAAWQTGSMRAGVRFVVVSPSRDDTASELGAQWMPLRPNTDTAMMLAMAHTLLVEGRYDRHFVHACCAGFDRVAAHLRGEDDGVEKSAAWAAEICDVAAETIVDLARQLASCRSLVTLSWSLQRQHHGEMPYWAGFALAAMAGSMGKPGGGVGTGYSSIHNAYVHDRVSVAAALPSLPNSVPDFIPVARISDMLLDPGGAFDYDGSRSSYPDIRLVYWAGGNPFHHHQDLNRMLRAWQHPETIVVHEPYWNAMAKHADIVFPVATSLERDDLAMGLGDPWLVAMQQVAAPPEGVRTDYDVFARLARRLGAGQRFTEGRTADEWVRELYERSVRTCAEMGIELPSYAEFRRRGQIELPLSWDGPVAFEELRADPARHPLETPSGKLELYSETVAGFGYDDCPGFPTWLEPAEWLGGSLARAYPLHMVSAQPEHKLHGQLDHGAASMAAKVQSREVVWMARADAVARGFDDGEVVRVFNERGACLAAVRVTEGLRPGVVRLATGAWYDPLTPGEIGALDKHGNPNVLTPDIPASKLSQAPSAHTCLVEVERFDGPLPPVTAHDPPRLARQPPAASTSE